MNENFIQINGISKHFGNVKAVDDVSFSIREGEFFSLLGPSGCGKTTLLRLLAGFEYPTNGNLLIDGSDITALPPDKRPTNMVFQNYAIFPHINVEQNIKFGLRKLGLTDDEIKKRVDDVLALVKLEGYEERFSGQLSGGQRQRVALARALVKDSDLILLDEPLANLDFKLREELREELPKLFEDRDCIVVYATTEPSEALLLGGNTATLLEGKVIQYGKTLDVYNKPNSLVSAQVFSDPPMNITKIKKSGESCSFLDNSVNWKTKINIKDGEYKVGIRPHNITTYKEGNNSLEIKGKVLISELSGSESLIHFTRGNLNWVSLSNGVFQKNVGDEMKLYMNADEFIYFDENERLVING